MSFNQIERVLNGESIVGIVREQSDREMAFWGAVSEYLSVPLDRIDESIFNKFILKGVFMAGGGGVGKSFISDKMFGGLGLVTVNSDPAFERALKRAGLDPKTDVGTVAAQTIRQRVKNVTDLKMRNFLGNRLGLIIDGTGSDPEKIIRERSELGSLGYDTSMVMVDTTLEVALKRNSERGRVVPEHIVKADWENVQKNIQRYRSIFGSRFSVVDNSQFLGKQEVAVLTRELTRKAMRFLTSPVQNPIGRAWIEDQLADTPAALRKLVPSAR